VVGALAGTGWRLDRTWALLGAGVLIFWIADSFYLVRVATDSYVSNSWFDAGWWAGLVLISAAAWQPAPVADAEPPKEGDRLIVMPLLFGVIGLTLAHLRIVRRLKPAGRRPRRCLAGRRDAPAHPHLP
jgi:hypothetical protein